MFCLSMRRLWFSRLLHYDVRFHGHEMIINVLAKSLGESDVDIPL